jgi:hypothetical protein
MLVWKHGILGKIVSDISGGTFIINHIVDYQNSENHKIDIFDANHLTP